MAQLDITLDTELLHGLFTKDNRDDSFSKLLEAILNQVLIAQSIRSGYLKEKRNLETHFHLNYM